MSSFMLYAQTPTYVDHVRKLREEASVLQSTLDELSTMKRGTRSAEQRRQLASSRTRLKTLTKALATVDDLSSFTWPALFTMLVEVDGCAWTLEELRLMEGELANYEGRGERSLRHRLGLVTGASLGTFDFPDEGEGKYVGDKIDTFRVGKVGKRAYGRLARELARSFKEDAMQPEQWDMVSDGEVSAGKVYYGLPVPVREVLQQALAPEKVLSCYQTLYLLSDRGFVRVRRLDFSNAFTLAGVTQMSPKYRLRRDYVESRLHRSGSHEG